MGTSIAVQTAQAAGLSALSNLIAQLMEANASGLYSFQIGKLTKYILYSILNTPLNSLWQEFLEQRFPSHTAEEPRNTRPAQQKLEQPQNLSNLALKFLLDQTIGAAGNIIFFITVSGFLNGLSLAQIGQSILEDSSGIYYSGLMVWPLVSLISFAWVPADQRVLFGCIAGVLWGVYLSLVSVGG